VNARLKAVLGVAIATAAMAMAAGCGSSGDSSSAQGDTSSLSKAAFIKQANAACLKERSDTLEKAVAYAKSHRSEGLPQAALTRKAIKTVEVAAITRELADLRELPPPAADKKEVEAILAEQQAGLEDAKRHLRDLSRDMEASFIKPDKRLRAYGLTKCSKGTG
jgi:hypothetical protein